MTNQRPDAEQERAQIRKELADDADEREEEQAVEEASYAPPGHVGERMLEHERPERRP